LTTVAIRIADSPVHVGAIQRLSRREWASIANDELARFLAVVDGLSEAEWQLPTACHLWNVRDIVAHQGGHVQMGSGAKGLFAQFQPKYTRAYKHLGLSGNDAVNQAQVEMRHDRSPSELVAEVRDGTPRSIASRARMNPLARNIRLPVPGHGLMSLDHLLHVIFPRDMWIHRLDIADATGRAFEITPGHDDRLLEGVVVDMERHVRRLLPGRSIRLTIEGPAGGTWLLGEGEEVAVAMDLPTFLRRSSERRTAAETLPHATVDAPTESERLAALNAIVAIYLPLTPPKGVN
jgi:uncharacterized protein (TIGR03083 family)